MGRPTTCQPQMTHLHNPEEVESKRDAVNMERLLIQHALRAHIAPELALCIASFCCADISYSILPRVPLSSRWPLLTLENDNAFIGFMPSDSHSANAAIFTVSLSEQSGAASSKWHNVGAITSKQRMLAVSARSPCLPRCIRIRNNDGEETLFTLHGTRRAVFATESRELRSVNPRTIRKIKDDGYGSTVLCGDGQAISATLCHRFCIRFTLNHVTNGFRVGFMRGGTDKVRLDECECENAVGIEVSESSFYLFDKENTYKKLAAHLQGASFPASGQEWLMEFDFVVHCFCLYLCLQKRWMLALKLDITESHIVPVFSLLDESDEIEIVGE